MAARVKKGVSGGEAGREGRSTGEGVRGRGVKEGKRGTEERG